MEKNSAGKVLALDFIVILIYWVVIIILMRDRIGAQYGEYATFENLNILHSILLPLLLLAIGFVPFIKGALKAWKFLVVSLCTPVIMEFLGAVGIMIFYRQTLQDTFIMLQTTFHVFLYTVVNLFLFGVLFAIRSILRAVKKKSINLTEYEREKLRINSHRSSAYAGQLKIFKSSGILLIINIIITALSWSAGAFLVVGAIQIYLLYNINYLILLGVITIAAAVSVMIVIAFGITRVEVGEEGVVFKRGNRTTGTYLFEDYRMTASKTRHLVLGVISLYTDYEIVMSDRTGYEARVRCRNFSEKTFTALMDDITVRKRSQLIQNNQDKGDAGEIIKSKSLILPLPGEDEFVSVDFSINKGKMVAAEQKRHRHIILGLLLSAAALYACWYFFVYRTAADAIPELPVFTGFLIAALFVVLPTVTMTLRFNQEEKRIPVSIRIENETFTIDRETFKRAQVQDFKLTEPGEVAGTSHRRHLCFTSDGKCRIYMLGSGVVKKAGFPDYNLLYKIFEAQRVYIERGVPIFRQTQRTFEKMIHLSAYAKATIQVPCRPELGEAARIITHADTAVMRQAEEIIDNPLKFAEAHSYEFMCHGLRVTYYLPVDLVNQVNLAILLETHQYSVMIVEDEYVNGMLGKLNSIIQAHALPIDLSVFTYSNETYASDVLQNISDQLQMQGYQLGTINIEDYKSLFFIKTSDVYKLRSVTLSLGMDILPGDCL